MRIYLQMQMNFCANRCQCQKCDANPDLFPSKQIALPTHSVGVGPTHCSTSCDAVAARQRNAADFQQKCSPDPQCESQSL